MNIIPKNTIVMFSDGNYSDYSIDGIYVTEEEIDMDLQLKEFEKENPLKTHKYNWGKNKVWDDPQIAKFLVEKKLLKKVTYFEVHRNAYPYEVQPKDIRVINREDN